MKIFVVATVQRPPVIGGDDLFGDIILISKSEDEARTVSYVVKERRPYPSLDYNLLARFDDCIYFERELGKVISNKEG